LEGCTPNHAHDDGGETVVGSGLARDGADRGHIVGFQAPAQRIDQQLFDDCGDEVIRPRQNRLSQAGYAVHLGAIGELAGRRDRRAGFFGPPGSYGIEIIQREADGIHQLVATGADGIGAVHLQPRPQCAGRCAFGVFRKRRHLRQRRRRSTRAAVAVSARLGEAQKVPNSSGAEPAKLRAPVGACDSRHHIYDDVRFPPTQPGGEIVPDARVEEFRMLQKRIGTSRNVVVTPRAYVTDNRVTLDAITRLGANARGVAVIHPTVTDAELKMLAEGGIRGIRFSITDPRNSSTSFEMIEPLSKRVNTLGWHVQIKYDRRSNCRRRGIVESPSLGDCVRPLGPGPQPAGVRHQVFNTISRLVDKGRTWVKLSVTYDNTRDGPPGYADISRVAEAYIRAAPERMVWGSNWPHPNETNKPDDAALFDLMARWAPDEKTRNRILVENPAVLYGFPKPA